MEENMRLIITTMGICALLTGVTPGVAQEQKDKEQSSGLKSEETQTIKATVQKVDSEKREVTLKGESGKTVTIKVPETARNFDQIKTGDIVTAKYTQSVALSVRKSDEPPSATGRESITRAPQGQRPAAQRTSTMQINATIEKIDRDKRELTLMGPEGNTRTVKVPTDIKKFDELKEGDQVVINATESFAIEVSTPEK
jgi:Cu/Ag efflux protein CusF